MATAMMMLGNMDKAREYGERAVQADPGNILAHSLLERIEDIERIHKREGRPLAWLELKVSRVPAHLGVRNVVTTIKR